jgi:hypothetical protein
MFGRVWYQLELLTYESSSFIVSDCVALHGDSGAPIISADADENFHVVGVQTAIGQIGGVSRSIASRRQVRDYIMQWADIDSRRWLNSLRRAEIAFFHSSETGICLEATKRVMVFTCIFRRCSNSALVDCK